ncbi:MAG: class I SAM-dependent methyltransferase [Alphaproteobacteria bacterium]|nr:class I SAM-dependent methyltransferase [Alphaproteobacteria bacterium]
MTNVRRDGASFRDPSGQVYRTGDRVLRSVTEFGAADYEFVRDSGLLTGLVAAKRVIGIEEVTPDLLDDVDAKYLLEHPVLPFISYPYEWCFSALRAAALLQLDLLMEALAYDVTLSDASAYNVQFRGPAPVFIDALSFCRYQEGDYWTAHQQFCMHFLNPLLLTALRGVGFNAWLRGNLEGIRADELNQLLAWHQKLNWRIMTHVVLPVRFQANARGGRNARIDQVKERRLPRASFRLMIDGLRNWVARLTPAKNMQSVWRNYASDNSYDSDAAEAKADFTRRFAATVKPEMLWDIGCNTGVYTEIALKAGAREAVGFDTDMGAIEGAFARANENGLPFLPLIMDAADPSPGRGWRGIERKSLADRANANGLLAYAVLHHLVIGRNIPLPEVVAWLIGLAPQGVIEFVEKEDPMVREMLRIREDIFADYDRESFLSDVRAHAEIVETNEVIENRRLLVWYRRQAN